MWRLCGRFDELLKFHFLCRFTLGEVIYRCSSEGHTVVFLLVSFTGFAHRLVSGNCTDLRCVESQHFPLSPSKIKPLDLRPINLFHYMGLTIFFLCS